MAGPPLDISAQELWALMASAEPLSAEATWPRKLNGQEYKIRVRVASQKNIEDARWEARKELLAEGYTLEELTDIFIRDTHGDRVNQHMIAATVYDNVLLEDVKKKGGFPYTRMFSKWQDVQARLSPEEQAVLLSTWQITQLRLGPYSGNIDTEQELSEWIKRLAEGGSAYPLARRNSLQLVELAFSFALRAYSLHQILESLPDLPPTLTSALKSLSTDIGSFSLRPVTYTETGFRFGPSVASSADIEAPPLGRDESAVSIETATGMARELYSDLND